MYRAHLFEEFPDISTEAWEEQIQKDLRGADYGEILLWHLSDGFTARPYYRAEDVAAIKTEREAEPAVEVPLGWKLRQDIRTPDLESASRHARSAVDAGVDILGIDLRIDGARCLGVPLHRSSDFRRLLAGLSLSDVALHVDGGALGPRLFALYADYVRDGDTAAPFSLGFDPVAECVRSGRQLDHLLDLSADMIRLAEEKELSGARVLAVRSGVYQNAGATAVQATALLLAAISELIVRLIERGITAEQVLGRVLIETSIGSSYFIEIARLRALRILLRQLVDIFVPNKDVHLPPIHGTASTRNQTLYDPHENLLRSTTEAASAAIGGCDVVAVHPFDEISGRYDEFSYRMARNVQHILRFEGGFARVADPAAGSYYVEVLTNGFARRSWQLFQEIESRGGFFESLEDGFIHGQLGASAAEARLAVAERRTVLVGTNHYPNRDERRSEEIAVHDGEDLGEELLSLMEGPSIAEPLVSERLAEPVEQRRLRTERMGRDVRLLLVPFGESAVKSERVNFAATFLGCGGFRIVSAPAITDSREVGKALRDLRPDVVVFCADDEAYAHLLDDVDHEVTTWQQQIPRGIVAGPEVAAQLKEGQCDFAISEGSNLLDVVDDLHEMLGVSDDPGPGQASSSSVESSDSAEDRI